MNVMEALKWLNKNKGWIDHYEVPNDVVETCIEALTKLDRLQKKETPMIPEATLDVKGRLDFICPRCNRRDIAMSDKYCCNCGQKLLWER